MENKKYAPLIGKKLTWEILESLMSDIKEEIARANSSRSRARKLAKPSVPVHTEDDGS